MTDRYTDQPFLRYVDAWVMDAIGHLDEPTRAYCVAMESTLRQSLGLTGSWTDMVAQQMKFAPDLPSQIQRIWAEGKSRFEEANGTPADPLQFAMIFVDRNFGRA